MKHPLRFAAIAVSTVSLPGAAMAATMIDTTGPGSANVVDHQSNTRVSQTNSNRADISNDNQQTAMSGDVTSGGNTSSGGSGSGWGDWDPERWQGEGRSFGDWWNATMRGLNSSSMSGWGNSTSWRPSGENWQNSWANWDPQLWQANGSSRSNWYMQVLPHLSSQYNQLRSGWDAGRGAGNTVGGDATSGDAANANATATDVTLRNNAADAATLASMLAMNGESGDVVIGTTGPDSYNEVTHRSNTTLEMTNLNDVSVNNRNDQSAVSGNVTSSRNTVSGSASSGSASNSNQTSTMVEISN